MNRAVCALALATAPVAGGAEATTLTFSIDVTQRYLFPVVDGVVNPVLDPTYKGDTFLYKMKIDEHSYRVTSWTIVYPWVVQETNLGTFDSEMPKLDLITEEPFVDKVYRGEISSTESRASIYLGKYIYPGVNYYDGTTYSSILSQDVTIYEDYLKTEMFSLGFFRYSFPTDEIYSAGIDNIDHVISQYWSSGMQFDFNTRYIMNLYAFDPVMGIGAVVDASGVSYQGKAVLVDVVRDAAVPVSEPGMLGLLGLGFVGLGAMYLRRRRPAASPGNSGEIPGTSY
jgi:hypothetical protein